MESVLSGLEPEIEKIMSRYPQRRSGLLPVLWLVQRRLGYVPEHSYPEIAACAACTPEQVAEVVTFYTMYNRRPVGQYVLQVCTTLPCALCGAEGISEYIQTKLGVQLDEVTPDGVFMVQAVECLGACDEAPMMLVNETVKTRLTKDGVDQILAECRRNAAEKRTA